MARIAQREYADRYKNHHQPYKQERNLTSSTLDDRKNRCGAHADAPGVQGYLVYEPKRRS